MGRVALLEVDLSFWLPLLYPVQQMFNPVEVDKLSTQPKACLPYKNPIYPMTGTKREVVETGFVLGDQELQLVYDTAGRPSTKLREQQFP